MLTYLDIYSNNKTIWFQKNKLCERLIEIWKLSDGCEILYNYYDYLQNEFLSELTVNNQLILQHENEDDELCDSFEAIRIYCDEISAKEKLKQIITCDICFDDFPGSECTLLEGFNLIFNLQILGNCIFNI